MNKFTFTVEGKVSLITGGAGGLGRAFADELLDRKGKVCIADFNSTLGKEIEERLQRKYGKENVFFQKCNVVSESEFEEAIKETIRRFGRLDILCNNAGVVDEHADWKRVIDINLTAVVQGTYLGFKYMGTAVGQSEGVIINIASLAGFIPHTPGPVYAVTKYGVIGLSRSVGVQSRKLCGVRVNALCPSFTQTEMIEKEGQDLDYMKKLFKTVGIMKPRDVSECFVRLAEADVSGATMLATPHCKEIIRLPKTVAEVINLYPKL